MSAAPEGYLLLCAELGDGRRPLTLPQLRQLRRRMQNAAPPEAAERDVCAADLMQLGYDSQAAARLVGLLERQSELDEYLALGRAHGAAPLCMGQAQYPALLTQRLGQLAPPVLFYRGNLELLRRPSVAVVGARTLSEAGARFAQRCGTLAAQEGLTLVSGNAPGADQTAQQACLAAGGCVILVTAGALSELAQPTERVLQLSEGGWHLPFTPYRALSRNRVIHALGALALVAQTQNGTGGTWRGTVENLRLGLSPVFVHDDGSQGAAALAQLGANLLAPDALRSISGLQQAQFSLFAE